MNVEQDELKSVIQKLLGKEITHFVLKGQGYCNNAYYVETREGGKYIVKQERTDALGSKQDNDLLVEAALLRQLNTLQLSLATPRVVFVSVNPKMICYEYLAGDLMIGLWNVFSEKERIDICRALGRFHVEIGKKITKEMAQATGIKINESMDIHPENIEDNHKILASADVPEEFKSLVKEARTIFDGTQYTPVFQFIHNDSHHENILIENNKISGIIDFGNAEYGEVTKEFSRYIRDYPDYFQHIVSSYEENSGHKLSYARLVIYAFLSGFIDIINNYLKGGEDQIKAEKAIETYKKLMDVIQKES